MKQCSRCKTSTNDFGPDKRRPHGLQSQCRPCMRIGRKISSDKYRDKVNANAAIYRESHKKEIKDYFKSYSKNPTRRAYMDQWYKNNAEKMSSLHKKWRLKNLAKRASDAAAYRSKMKNATPKWLTKTHWSLIEMNYQLARYLTDQTGFEWEVDHIIPINHLNIQGLHVPWNLRVIPMKENESKSNRLINA